MNKQSARFIFIAVSLLATLLCANLGAQTLDQQKATAADIAKQDAAVTEDQAQSIADSLAEAFGAGEDMDALLARLSELSTAHPEQAAAIAAASTAFLPTPEFAARAAAAAARAVPAEAADIAQSVSRAVPAAAAEVAAAVKNAAPNADPGAIDAAADQGAQQGSGGGEGGGGGGGGGVLMPSGAAGGSGGGSGGTIY